MMTSWTLVLLCTIVVTEAAKGTTKCGKGWKAYRSSCYTTVTKLMNYGQADEICRRMDAKLAEINTNGESRFLVKTFGPIVGDAHAWVRIAVANGKGTRMIPARIIRHAKRYNLGLIGVYIHDKKQLICEQDRGAKGKQKEDKRKDTDAGEKRRWQRMATEGKHCAPGWAQRGMSCYKMLYEKRSFQDAHETCSKMKAHLADINSRSEMWHLLYKFGKTDVQRWVSIPLMYNRKRSGTLSIKLVPVPKLPKYRVGLFGIRGRERMPFVCEQLASSTHATQEKKSSGGNVKDCGVGWTKYETRCYRLFTSGLNFEKAHQACTEHNASLAELNGKPEIDFLLKTYGPSRTVPWVKMQIEAKEKKMETIPTRLFHIHNENIGIYGDKLSDPRKKAAYICERETRTACWEGWERFKDRCYRYVKGTYPFRWSENWCKEHNAHLASVNSKQELDFLLKYVWTTPYSCGPWIGLLTINNKTFTWLDHSSTSYKPPTRVASGRGRRGLVGRLNKWKRTTLGAKLQFQGVAVVKREGTHKQPFICERGLGIGSRQVGREPKNEKRKRREGKKMKNVHVRCEKGWRGYQGHCYRVIRRKKQFKEAEKTCVRLGGHLASANSALEFRFLVRIARKMHRDRTRRQAGPSAWLGMKIDASIKPSRFTWTDGSRTEYKPPGEYKGDKGEIVARLLEERRQVNDIEPSRSYPFICERVPETRKTSKPRNPKEHLNKKQRHGHNPTYKRKNWHKKETDAKTIKHRLGRRHEKDIKKAKVIGRKAHDRSDKRKVEELESKCPGDWKRWSGYCYKYFATKLSFRSAEADCREYGRSSHLSSIHSRDELEMLMAMIPRPNATKRRVLLVWVGMIIPEGQKPGNVTWKWTDGTSAAYEPPRKLDLRPQGANAARLILYKAHDKWESKGVYDTIGTRRLPYICKRKPGK
ncbi:C-type mannose receptor 2-like [Lineus longissimus]|uniref:C-type mannose receptor 2-like n=1 Tax=Lineus longissimus TaxID=88925 RepID=UPI002B4C7375